MKLTNVQGGATILPANKLPYKFADPALPEDFERLAGYLNQASQEMLHPALYSQRCEISDSLRKMATESQEEANQNAYHALRLFVF